MHERIVIGTRGSKLARAQADIIATRLKKAVPEFTVEIKIIVTTGDRDQQSHLSAIGGKGIFIRELEQALLDGSIDCAVHSFKDVTSQLAPGLVLSGFLRPESVCDVMVTNNITAIGQLRPGARIGTGSMRRKALLLRMRPDLEIVEIRGNVDTRIAKVDRHEYDGIMLSEAGLIRLGLTERISVRLDPEHFYPAPGQGVITIETRADDLSTNKCVRKIGDAEQHIISSAELALITTIGFDCRTPLGVFTSSAEGHLVMRGFFVDPAYNKFRECKVAGEVDNPAALGKLLAKRLLEETICDDVSRIS